MKKLTKKQKIILLGTLFIVLIIGIVASFILFKPKENQTDLPIKDDVSIILKEDLSFEINSEIFISALLAEKNTVKILNNEEKIDTSSLGEKEIIIKYLEDEKELEKNIKINIVDTIAPTIESKEELTTTLNKEIDLLADVKVTDNSKEEIKATVEGTYDFNKEGTYNLKYVAIDSSNNKEEKEFVLKVTKDKNTNNSTNTSTNKNPTTNKKPTNNSETNNNNPSEEDYDDEPIDYANSVVALSFGESTVNSQVVYFGGAGSIGATGFELYVYSEDGKLLNTYDIKNTTSYKLTNLGFRTTYYLHAKSYIMENGSKKYLCQTEGFNDYKRGRNFFTKHDDKIYENELFKYINSKNNNKFTREVKFDNAAKTCAKMYREQILANGKSTVTAEDCLAQNGINNVRMARFAYAAYPGKICVTGTTSCTGTTFSYVKLDDSKNKLLYTYAAYKHVGVAYYENVAVAIYAVYNGE